MLTISSKCINFDEIIDMKTFYKGRGAQLNPHNPFEKELRSLDPLLEFGEGVEQIKTNVVESQASSIVNKVISPDVGLEYSINPYQGCEHGCVYCYARNSHNYWGYSAGTDFETNIIVKLNAAELLDKKLSSKSWNAAPIVLSGNTDCYQPVEKKYKITRQLLEVFWKHKHPVGIVTKNNLILRDLDILTNLAQHNLVSVAISLNTLDDKFRQKLEPRASSVKTRLNLIERLTKAGIHVSVLAAPIIPGLNDDEILGLAKAVSKAGAKSLYHIVVRLNGGVKDIFIDWLKKHYGDRELKVINKIKALHNGNLGSSQFGKRMKGEGVIADMIHQQFRLARKLYMLNNEKYNYNTSLFAESKLVQGVLF